LFQDVEKMFLSKRCLYGLRAILYLVIQPEERGYVPIKEIAETLRVPFHFLTKVLQDLTQAGVLLSSRGVSGGVKLARPARELDVLQIIETLEGENFFRGCVLGFSECSGKKPCALHEQWAVLRQQILDMFSSENLEEIAARIGEENLRLFEPGRR
jgi:Rrf2 family iron-sulfur cluster assembly transcriptional regulator